VQKWKSYWAGVTKLSKNFAQQYTGGRDMAVGFGGYFSVCAPASKGPALAAIRTPDSTRDTLDLAEMMTYSDPSASERDGNYIPFCTYWNTIPQSPWQGKWEKEDFCRAGIFIDLPDKHGYLAFPNLITGRIGYDYGGGDYDKSTGHQSYWYFYDPKNLGKAASGQMRPDSIHPSSRPAINYPTGGDLVTGVCFDPESRMIYLYLLNARNKNHYWGVYPIIHAYHIKEGSSSAATTNTPRRAPASAAIQFTIDGNRLTIKNNGRYISQAYVRIVNAQGVQVKFAKVPGNKANRYSISLAGLPQGVYVAELVSDYAIVASSFNFFK
jgi:hypothetical protein